MTKFEKFTNPYDFANPISEKDLFIGREDELTDIKYYLEQAKSSNPINLAILGPRASGKTSLLNICELVAKEKNFCVARIDLDENDSINFLNFYHKIFDSLITSAFELGAYGGLNEKTYEQYLDIVTAYTIPEEKLYCPFLFPTQFAKAMQSDNTKVLISDNIFKRDLITIRNELDKPILLLFDECNVLANSRVHLEKLRNIFMNVSGYMLILNGTEDLFPVMDEVFSPIIRQFKKISVGEFKNSRETRDCIIKPLDKIGINPYQLLALSPSGDNVIIKEIHEMANGKPYEIQLICHIIFRRLQERKSDKFRLDLAVLEHVLKELESTQDIKSRPILNSIINLDKKQLTALDALMCADCNADFQQLWSREYIFHGKKFFNKDDLRKHLDFFINKQIIHLDEETGNLNFNGDDFDKIYIKYFAKERRVSTNIQSIPIEVPFTTDFINRIVFDIKSQKETDIYPIGYIKNLKEIINSLYSRTDEKDLFTEYDRSIGELYKILFVHRENSTISIIQFKLILDWLEIGIDFYTVDTENENLENTILSLISEEIKRIEELGGKYSLDINTYPILNIDKLSEFVVKTSNIDLKENLANFHITEMTKLYLEKKDRNDALMSAELSYKYNPKPEPQQANNLGYIFMSNDNNEFAYELFTHTIKIQDEEEYNYFDSRQKALPYFNLAIVNAKMADYSKALENILLCKEILDEGDNESFELACLLIPEVKGEDLIFKEVLHPDIVKTTESSINILENYIKDQN